MDTAKEALEQRDTILNEYESNIGLPTNKSPGSKEELDKYLTMDRTALEAISDEECGIIAYRLGQFAFYIQRTQNRELARVSWAENEIKLAIADKINNYKGYGYVEKSAQAIKDDSHAAKLNQILVFAKQRAERLGFIANSLKNLSDILRGVQINKRRNHE